MSFYMNMALNEGQQKDDYIKRKEEEENKFEDKYAKRFNNDNDNGWRSSTTTLRGKDLKSNSWDQIKTPIPDDMYKVKKASKSFDADSRYNHAKKMDEDRGKANIVTARHLNKQQFEYDMGTRDKEPNTTHGNIAYATDAVARHNRRHPNAKLESGIFSECNFIEFAY